MLPKLSSIDRPGNVMYYHSLRIYPRHLGNHLGNKPTTKPPDSAIYLSAKEAAYILRINLDTLYGYLKAPDSGDLPYLKIGRIYRFHRARLMNWWEKQERV